MSSRFLSHRSFRQFLLPLLAAAFAALGVVPASRADQTLFSTYPHDGSFGVAAVISTPTASVSGASNRAAQRFSFSGSQSYVLTSVVAWVRRNGGSVDGSGTNFRARLCADNAGEPSTVLTELTTPAIDNVLGTDRTFTPTTAVVLQPNTLYWVVFEPTGAQSIFINWHAGSSSGTLATATGANNALSWNAWSLSLPSKTAALQILGLPPAPHVTQVSPTTGSGAGGTSVTITGTDLSGATAVTFGGVNAASFTVANNTSITAVTPPHAAGNAAVAVTTPSGTSDDADQTFTFVASTNSLLSNLVVSGVTLDPAFQSGTTTMSQTVPYARSSVTITPTVADSTATVTVNGTTVISGNASGSISLSVGSNDIATVVTAQDGTTQTTYTLTLVRSAASANANLSNVALSSGTLSPEFASGTTSYSVSVPNATTSITVTPTLAVGTASLTVNGTPTVSGNASNAIALDPGANTIEVAVTAEDGLTVKTYTITVTRAVTADLSALVLSAGTLTPAFSAATTTYYASVDTTTTGLMVTPTAADSSATITVNGVTVASGDASAAITLNPDVNTVTIVVTARDGLTTKTYTVSVTRPVPSAVIERGGSGPLTANGSSGGATFSGVKAGGGVDRLLLVAVSNNTATSITGVSFDGSALTKAVELTNNTAVAALFYLPLGTSASTTTGDLVVSSNGTTGAIFVQPAVYRHVDQTSPVSGAVSATGAGGTPNLNVVSEGGDLVVDYLHSFRATNQTSNEHSGQTEVFNWIYPISSGVAGEAMSTKPGASSVRLGWTTDATATVHLALNLKRARTGAQFMDTLSADFDDGTLDGTDAAYVEDALTLFGPVLDQSNSTLSSTGVGITVSTYGGQTFTAGKTGKLVRADLSLFASGVTGTTPALTVSVRATSGGLPTGADLATATIPGFNTGTGGTYTATFSSPASVQSGTLYALIVRPVANPSPGTYALTRSATDVYSGGNRVAGSTSGTVWSSPLTSGQTTDAGFAVYIAADYPADGDWTSPVRDSRPAPGHATRWSTLSWSAATPASTSLLFQVAASASEDGPFNFVGHDGTADTVFSTSDASLAQFDGFRYLRYRAIFATSDGAVTPTLNDVTVTYSTGAPPSLSSPSKTSVTATSATLGGTITDVGGASITERGVVYSLAETNNDPAIGGTGVTKLAASGTSAGAFNATVSGLSETSQYAFKAYATNAYGTSYTTVETVTTLALPTISSVSPDSGLVSGGTTVTLTGTNFTDATAVMFGGDSATSFTIDSATQITATSPALSAGAVNIRVTTGAGTSATAAANSFTYFSDVTAPDTTLTGTPQNPTGSTTATFVFTGDDSSGSGIASFEASLDGGSFVTSASPQTYTGLADGPHTFQVRAVDAAGNVDASPASYTWTIDSVAPAAPVVITPANGSTTNDNTPTYTGTAEANATITLIIDGTAVGTTTANGASSWSFTPVPALADGSHAVKASATDAAGNTSPDSNTHTFTVDTAPPAAPVVLTPAHEASLTNLQPVITGTAESNSTVTVIIDGTPVGTSPANGSGNWSLTSASLALGSHTVRASATDAAGNASPLSSINTFTLVQPALSIGDVTKTEGESGTTTFTFTVNLSLPAPTGGVTFDIATANGTATTGDSDYAARSLTGQTIAAGNSSYTFDVSVNGDAAIEGNETFFVNVTNVTGATVSDGQGAGTITNDDTLDLGITITDSPDPVAAGSDVIYTITITNSGTAASSAALSLPLPTGTTFSSLTTAGAWSATTPAVGSTGSIEATLASFAAGASAQFTLVANVGSTVASGTVLSASAQVTGGNDDANSANNSATATTTVVASADLAIALSAPSSASVGNLTYTFTITNNGPSAASDVVLEHVLPAGTSLISVAPSQGSVSVGASLGATVGTLASGATATISFTVTVSNVPDGGTLTIESGTLSSAATDENAANNTASASVAILSNNADLSNLTLSEGTLAPTFASETTDYTVSVATTIAAIKVTPTAGDAGATIEVNGTPVASGSPSGDIALTVGGNTITVVVTAENGTTTKTYTATVTRAVPVADMALAIEQSPNPASGSVNTYVVTVTNNGPDAATAALYLTFAGNQTYNTPTLPSGWYVFPFVTDETHLLLAQEEGQVIANEASVEFTITTDVTASTRGARLEISGVVLPAGTDPEQINNTLTLHTIVGPLFTPDAATPLTNVASGIRVTGHLDFPGRVDAYSFTAHAGDRVYAATATTASTEVGSDDDTMMSSRDTILKLVGSDGKTVIELDDDDGGLSSTSSNLAGVRVPADGTYYLVVEGQKPNGIIFPYELFVRLQTGEPIAETSESATGQILTGAAKWIRGATANGAETDTYVVTLPAGATIFAGLDLDPERDGSDWDAQLTLQRVGGDTNETFIMNGSDNVNGTLPRSEALLLTVKEAGDYLLEVSSGGGTFGSYHLSATVLPAATEAASKTYTSTDSDLTMIDGGALTSALSVDDDVRIGKLKVALRLTHPNLENLDVFLKDPSGNTVGLFRRVEQAPGATLDVVFDDDAAYAIGFHRTSGDENMRATAGAIFKPYRDYRLSWLSGRPAKGTWTLTVYDRAEDTVVGTLKSWSLIIDEESLAEPAGIRAEHLFSDFETSEANFTHFGTADAWAHGTPSASPINSAHSGTNAWKTNLVGNTASTSSQTLVSPSIDLTGVTPGDLVELSWAMNYQLADASTMSASVSVEEVGGGGDTHIAWRWLGPTMRATDVGATSLTIQEVAGWGLHRANISDFAGKTIRLRFHLESANAAEVAGLAIDDIGVASYHDVAPAVVSVVRHNNAPAATAAGTLMYRVQFSEDVLNVTPASFSLTTTDGDVAGTISSVVGRGSVYYVTVTGVTGSGTLRLDVLDGIIVDKDGRVLSADFVSGQSYKRVASVRAYAWGSNSGGKLGNGTEFSHEFPAFVRADAASALAGKTVAALAYGGEHTLALDSAGKVYAWGNNMQRQLGNGSDEGVIPLPVAVSADGALAGKTLVAIAASYVHSLALDSEGRVYSWGYNLHGELGLGSTAENIGEPTQVAGLLSGKTVVAIAAGRNHSVALASDGSLYAWGSANEGQLGNGISGGDAKSNVPVAVKMDGALAGKTIVAISAGIYHNLALASDGTAYGWGWNSNGQLGNGSHFDVAEPVAVNLGSTSALQGKTLVAVAAGAQHSLALDSAGKVYAWGFNISGQLGTENGAGPHYLPRAVNLPSGVMATVISAGDRHSFALTTDGVLYGWGSSDNGQLGIGDWDEHPTPVLVDTSAASALHGATVLALGSGGGFADHALALASTPRPVIETISTPTGAYKVGSTLLFELTSDRAVIVNTSGGTPRLLLFLEDGQVYADYVSTSDDGRTLRFSYTIKDDDGTSFGIGLQTHIELNGGTIVEAADSSIALTPAFPAPDLNDVVVDATAPSIKSIARAGGAAQANGLRTVAFNVAFSESVTGDGEELSEEDFSILAVNGNVTGRVSDVRLVIGGSDGRPRRMAARAKGRSSAAIYRVTLADLAGEGEFSLELSLSRPISDVAGNALTGSATSQSYMRFENASAFAWGKGDDGQLGNGNSETSDAPNAVQASGVLADKAIVAIAHGANHTLALTSDGNVYGWGSNLDGQLAIDDNASDEPVAISPTGALSGKFIVAIAAGEGFSVALTSEGEVITWGRNEAGELGIDSEDEFNAVPTLVDLEDFGDFEAPRIAAVAAGAHHVLALAENGDVVAWGANDVGQLGNEDISDAERAPVFTYTYASVAAIAAGANHSLALTFEGQVLSWGGNEAGQLGDGSEEDSSEPGSVSFPSLDAEEQPVDAIASIAAGEGYSLALTVDGRLFSWGANDTGQLGLGHDDNISAPARVNIEDDARLLTLAPARNVVLALGIDGTAYGWGDNTSYQLAFGDAEVFARPLQLPLAALEQTFVLGFGVTADHSTLLGVAAALAAPDLEAQSDTGASDSDNITKSTTLTFSGMAAPGVTVSLFDGETEIGSTTASNAIGAWSITASDFESGVHTITAAIPSLNVVSASLSVTIDTTAPAITSGASATAIYGSAFSGYTIAATDSSALAFTAANLPAGLSVNSSSGAITGTPTATGSSTATISATDAAGNSASSSVSFTVNRATATITLSNLSATYDGTSKSVSAVSVPADLPITITYDDAAAAPTNAGTYALVATIDSANYTGSATGTLTIAKADQTITFVAPSTAKVNQAVTLAATSTAGVSVVFSVQSGNATLAGSELTFNGEGAVVVRATASPNSNYKDAFVERTIASSKLAQTITFAAIPDKLSSDGDFALEATASSGLPITFTILSGPAQLSGATVALAGNAGTVVIRATQSGNSVYEPAESVTRSFEVTPAGDLVFFGDFFASVPTGESAYIGDGRVRAMALNDPKVGEIAAVLPANSATGSLLIVAPTIGINALVTFTPQSDGSFSTTIQQTGETPRSLVVKGQLTGATLSGTVEGTGYSFTTDIESPTGPSADAAGLYRSSSLETAQGTTYTVIGTNNNVLVLTITPSLTLGGMAALEEDGTFALELVANDGVTVTVQGAVDAPTNSVVGRILVPNQAPVEFAGLETTTTRTDRLIGLSSRGRVGTGADILISGLVIGGDQPKQVLIRAIGPALSQFGVPNVLVDPRIVLFRGQTPIADNDNWATNDNADEIAAAAQRVGLVGLPNDSKDALLLKTLAPGAYTVHIHGGEGIALAEVYDASENPGAETQRLVDIATRGNVGTGDNVLIGGLAITGNAPKRVLIRGVGPGLVAQGVTGALVDPKLTVYRGGSAIAENNDWSSDQATTALVTAAETAAGAFRLQPGSKDAAVVLTLAPGHYTVHVAGVNNTTGVALVEIYEVAE